MPKLLLLANFELSIELPEGTDADEAVRLKERKLLRVLRELASEGQGTSGELERLELESFSYDNAYESEPSGYYYNKHDNRVDPAL